MVPRCAALDLDPQHHLLYRRDEPVQRAGIWRDGVLAVSGEGGGDYRHDAGGAGIIFFGFGHSFPATGLENLWSHGGFAPNGWQGVIASLGIVMFAFGGVEIIGVTAAEAKDPKKVIPQAINTIPLRIILFYVCTLAVLMAIFPWNSFGEQGSPFVLIFDGLGIPAAATILNIIVISASISAINSDIFGAGRMMYGMSKRGWRRKASSASPATVCPG